MHLAVDDVKLYADVRGEGEAVVLLHGFPLTHRIWESSASSLARDYCVVAPDLRGMGASGLTAGPYLMERLAGDLAAMLDALGIERANIVGHSLGGYVALAFARMYDARVARLALVTSRLAADTPEIARSRSELAARIEEENAIDAVLETMLPRLLAPESPAALIETARAIALENSPAGLAAVLRGMAMRDDAHDIAADLSMPVMAIAGAEDRSISLEEARDLAGSFPNAELVVLDGVGHLPMLEDPVGLDRALRSLLAR
ncbi:MAG: alpha/beta fold hydrolase [Candidatus Eremiobacteraeota bacterium]|nr:alpha/beta fold hydrolase [Candidatus Eremiobacteraeota bacterium]